MRGLLDKILNDLTKFTANVATTKTNMKKTSLEVAVLMSSATVANVVAHTYTQEEVNRQNVFRLAYIRVKESMAWEITDSTVINITNLIDRHPDGVRFRKVNKYQMYQLIGTIKEGPKRPDPIKIRKQITEVVASSFDWRETGASNPEMLFADIVKTNTDLGVDIRHVIKVTIALATISVSACFTSGWG